MALTHSTLALQLGMPAPDFQLPDPDGKQYVLADFSPATALLVMFICNHCPYVVHLRGGLAQLANDYQPKGVKIVAISSNNIQTHPADSPDKMKIVAAESGWNFPYLYDEEQTVAKAYRAACTPDFFLFDSSFHLAYAGRFDASSPGNGLPVTGSDLRMAIDAVLNGERPKEGVSSMGCNIKWKPGNEPEYFG